MPAIFGTSIDHPLYRVSLNKLHFERGPERIDNGFIEGMSSLLRVFRLTNLEAAPMLYGAVQFDRTSLSTRSSPFAQMHQIHLCPITLATNFLQSIGRANRQSIRHLSLLMKVLLPKRKTTENVPQRSPYPKSFIKWDFENRCIRHFTSSNSSFTISAA